MRLAAGAPVSGSFELLGEEVAFSGRIIRAGIERFRMGDGSVVQRDKVWHPGAVGVLALDQGHVWLTRQPREAARLSASLEIPAGKLDVAGETPLECARRELAEEVGLRAGRWEPLLAFHTSVGFCDERIELFLASELEPALAGPRPDGDERIEVVRWPLARLWEAIAGSTDSKTLIALLWLAARREDGARVQETGA
ncbi:MAG TPA: NUDIX hydrolase [Solirubrobacteraceae bacterium]|nr:NUDIX hydrolase [Solirubrobacteraceae bacterium]